MTLQRMADGTEVLQPRPGFTERKAWHANRFGQWVVYVVAWPDHGVVKVGLTSQIRWVGFQATGGRVLQLTPYYTQRAALDNEGWLLEDLRIAALPAFRDAEDASSLLGSHGAGHSECFQMGIREAIEMLTETEET